MGRAISSQDLSFNLPPARTSTIRDGSSDSHRLRTDSTQMAIPSMLPTPSPRRRRPFCPLPQCSRSSSPMGIRPATNSQNNIVYAFTLSATDSTTFTNDIVNNSGQSYLIQPTAAAGYQFILDGRYRSAFNGPGINGAYGSSTNPNPAQFGNYRLNRDLLSNSAASTIGHGASGAVGMDEDYDACDLENWFMAIQSADGQIMVPSFHRPGILIAPDPADATKYYDWKNSILDWYNATDNTVKNQIGQSMAKILRPRGVDHSNRLLHGFPGPVSRHDLRHRQRRRRQDRFGPGSTWAMLPRRRCEWETLQAIICLHGHRSERSNSAEYRPAIWPAATPPGASAGGTQRRTYGSPRELGQRGRPDLCVGERLLQFSS